MTTYKLLVRVPTGVVMRIIEVQIQANDIGAAKGIATSQYGAKNVVSLPTPVR